MPRPLAQGQVAILAIAIAGLSAGTIACSVTGPASPTPGAVAATVMTGATSTLRPTPTFGGQVIDIVAKDQAFSLTEIEVASRAAFEISFENQDPFNHAIYIVAGADLPESTKEEDLVKGSAFRGDYFAGPATITYHVAALPPGIYTFLCPPHPPMAGTLIVK